MADNSEAGSQAVLQVLVVDDNQDAADSLGMLLHAWGYQVRVAYDGPSALQTLESFRPHCLFLDIGLPAMDGYTLAQQIRQRPGLGRSKLVALTAYSDQAHVERAREAGFDFHLVKPAPPSEIERLLKMLERVVQLVETTEELAKTNVELARETKDLLRDVKQDIEEVKEEVRDIKEELREVKENLNGQESTD